MKSSNIVSVLLGACLVCGTWSSSAYASYWIGYVNILSLAQETEGTLEIQPSTDPTEAETGCTDNTWFYVPATNSGAPTYVTLGPLILAAYLYNKPINFNLNGCNSIGRPIVIGIVVNG